MPGYDHLYGSTQTSGGTGQTGGFAGSGITGGGGSGGSGSGGSGSGGYDFSGTGSNNQLPPVVTTPPQITGPIVDTKVQEEEGEADFLTDRVIGATDFSGAAGAPPTYQDLIDQRNEDAYNQSLVNQQQMQDARDLAGQYENRIDQLTNKQLLDLQKAGLFTHQAEGELGGVMEYEKQVNLLKQKIQGKIDRLATQGFGPGDPQFDEGLASLPEYQQLAKLYGNIGGAETMLGNVMSPGTGYDPTGTNTWQDTESDPRKLEAYQALTGGDLSAADLRKYLPSIGYSESTGSGSGEQQFWDTPNYDPRGRTFDLLRFLQAGLPQKGMEQSGFFSEMKDPYATDVSEALNKGIFSGAIGQGVMDPKSLRRLITSFGSGETKPRYANVAKGGIVSLVGE